MDYVVSPRPTPPARNATPLAKRLAEQRGIDLAAMRGSGSGGRIVLTDLGEPSNPVLRPGATIFRRSFVQGASQPDRHFTVVSAEQDRFARTDTDLDVPRTTRRYDVAIDILLDPLIDLRGRLNHALADREDRVSLTALLAKAQAAALCEVPACNVRMAEGEPVRVRHADITVALITPAGLATPMIPCVDTMPLSAITVELDRLVEAGRSGLLDRQAEQVGAVGFANAGIFGVKQFTNTAGDKQALTLAVGQAERRYGTEGWQLVANVSGSFHTRMIDQGAAIAFMALFKRYVEAPMVLLA